MSRAESNGPPSVVFEPEKSEWIPSDNLEPPPEEKSTKTGKGKGKQPKTDEIKAVKQAVKARSPEEVAEHQSLVLKLCRYGASNRFGEYLKSNGFDLKPSRLKELSVPELQELQQRVQITTGAKNSSSYIADSVLGGLQLGETLAMATKLKERWNISGMTDRLRVDENFLDALEELQLENQDWTAISPEKRLLLITMQQAQICAMMNRKMDTVKDRLRARAEETKTAEATTKETTPSPAVEAAEVAEARRDEDDDIVPLNELVMGDLDSDSDDEKKEDVA